MPPSPTGGGKQTARSIAAPIDREIHPLPNARFRPGRTDRVTNVQQDNYECDVLVVGSGAAGMSAAVTAGHRGLNVLIVEKEPRFGGTTARSGGWLWIPGTSLARDWGIVEEPRAGADLSAPRSRQQFRRRPRRRVPGGRSRGGGLSSPARPRSVRHAADLSGLSRRSAGRRAGRPLDGDAAVRRPRTRVSTSRISAVPCPNSPCSA